MNSRFYRFVFAVALVICASGGSVAAQRDDAVQRDEDRLNELLLRAGKFVRDAKAQLNGVIADESYEQTVNNPVAAASTGSRRTLRSEVLFMALPETRGLVFVRTVLSVNGRAVPDSSERLSRLFNDPPADPYAYLMQLKQESARFNIGSVVRTTGDPAFALGFLDPYLQPRFSFTRAGVERIGAVQAVKLAFSEEEYPTLIAVNGANVLASGTVWIDPADGSILRTNVKVKIPDGNASVTVDFRRDEHLQQWVPWRMSELYGSGTAQETKCSASYTNVRRFDASVRVLPP